MGQDRHLVKRLRQGDQAALRRIYEKYKDDLLSLAMGMLANYAAAEDCLHDVIVAFASRAPALRLRGSLKGYLATCVANRARDELRSRARRAKAANLDVVVNAPAAEDCSAADQAASREQAGRLYAALATLPAEQREVVLLHLHGGLRFRRIAETRSVSINTVQSRYRYALAKLRTLLAEEGS